jgi:hypothetical protein
MRLHRAYAVIVTIAMVGCDANDAIRRFTPADADTRARAYLALFTTGQVDSAVVRLHPKLAGAEATLQLNKVGALLDRQSFDSTRVVGAWTNTVAGVRHVNLTYELHSARGWSLANVATVDSANTWFVEGITARALDRPLEELTGFDFRGKSARHYLWLLLTILAAATSLSTACWIATRRQMPKRWRWVLASLLGIGAFSINWATGEMGFRLINIQLAAAALTRAGPVAPWILTFGLPVGAVAALVRYRRWSRSGLAAAHQDTSAPQTAI